MKRLKALLSAGDIHAIADHLDQIVATAAERLNEGFNRRRLAKASRVAEPLPTDPRQLSSYRTRIGTMLEYGLGSQIDAMIEADGAGFALTFAVAHEYPDFYLRDSALSRLLRIEMKAVDADSDEQAARFAVPTASIVTAQDLLLLVAWEWVPIHSGVTVIGECPHIFKTLVVAAADIARERDIRLALTGGEIRPDGVFVPGRGGEMVIDPGNYGKFWRLVHRDRHGADDLSPGVLKFMDFLKEVNLRAPRNRFRD